MNFCWCGRGSHVPGIACHLGSRSGRGGGWGGGGAGEKIVKRGFLGSGCCVLSCLLQFSFFNTVSHLFLTLVSSFVFYFPSQPSEFIIWVSASFSSKRCLIQFSIFNFRFGISHVFTHAPAPAVNKKYVIAPLTFLFFFHLLFHDFFNLSPSFVLSRLVSKFNRALFGRFVEFAHIKVTILELWLANCPIFPATGVKS